MGWVVGLAAGAVAALVVLGAGVRLIARGRREGRQPDTAPEDRMVASFRVAAGVRLVNKGLLLAVLVAVAAYVWRR